METWLYFCSSQVLILASLGCFFGQGWMWRRYAGDGRTMPLWWRVMLLALGALFLLGALLAVYMLAILLTR